MDRAGTIALLASSVIAVTIAAICGVFRTRQDWSGERLVSPQSVTLLILASLAGVFAWLGTQVVYGAINAARLGRGDGPVVMSSRDIAFLSIVPPALATIVMLAALRSNASQDLTADIGLAFRKFPRGLLLAMVSLVVVLPLVAWTLVGLEQLYEAINYSHPNEHELLKQIADSSDLLPRVAMIVGALVLVPLFEEMLFRGGVQTILRTSLGRRGVSPWIAIVTTSILFAAIHAIWMAPAIFVLSVCIGYLYERSGNLWAAILLHAGFNATMVVLHGLS